MDHYKKKLKIRIALLTIPVVLGLVLILYGQFFADDKNDFLIAFQMGAAFGLGILGIVYIVRYSTILRNESKLKHQFNVENDERMKAIRAKAGLPFVLITSIAMVIAGTVAGYFNYIVFCTLTAAALVQLAVCCIVKLLYMRSM